MNQNDQERIELSIEGRVQGVGFRHFTLTTARKLDGVTGWVKNERDGSVTVVAEGPSAELQQLRSAVEEGPRSARVDNIDEKTKKYSDDFTTFEVRY